MKKKILAAVMAATMVLALTACGGSKDEPATDDNKATEAPADTDQDADADADASSGELIKVGVINNDPSESGYRTANDADLKAMFTKENGYDAQFAYSLKNDEQITAAQQFITDGVNYLLLSAADTAGWDGVLNSAKEAGVKVILFDRVVDADESLYEASIVSDMNAEGERAVEWLLGQEKEGGLKVVHIQGHMGSAAQKGRSGALQAAADEGKLEIVEQQTADWSTETAMEITQQVISADKEFNVIYAENDGMAQGAVEALDAAGITHGVDGDVIVMGFDCNKWALKEVLEGRWNYDGQCNPFQASYIDEVIKKLEKGEAIEEKTIILEEKGFDAATITEDDIAQYGIGSETAE